jgi:hypothetical protein
MFEGFEVYHPLHYASGYLDTLNSDDAVLTRQLRTKVVIYTLPDPKSLHISDTGIRGCVDILPLIRARLRAPDIDIEIMHVGSNSDVPA